MSDYKYISNEEDFYSCVTPMEIEEQVKQQAKDSNMILSERGIMNSFISSNMGHNSKITK